MKIFFIFFSIILFANCSSRSYVYSDKISNRPADYNNSKWMSPDDPEFPDKNKYALLASGSNGIIITDLDDEKLMTVGSFFIILPGKHSIRLKYQSGGRSSIGDKEVKFEIKPNQTGIVCANIEGRNWSPSVIVMDGYYPLLDNPYSPCY
jgi:hypothetical protein